MLDLDDSWEDIQSKLDEHYLTHSLHDTLHHLYDQQIRVGFIHETLRKQVQSLTRISDPSPQSNAFFYLQFNPHRRHRGLAEVEDPNPIHRIAFKGGIPCFCCKEIVQYQWPLERGFQTRIHDTDLLFIPNMSPIFDTHFTIATREHRPQALHIPLLHAVSRALPGHWIIQNGADAGASNPEHFHLQSYEAATLPFVSFPIKNKTQTQTGLQISELAHPATLFHFSYTQNPKDNEAALEKFLSQFLEKNTAHRFNILIKHHHHGAVEGGIVLRHTDRRTPLYKSGQPGYAEPAGIISSVDESGHQKWLDQGWDLYQTLLSDIKVPKDTLAGLQQQLQTL